MACIVLLTSLSVVMSLIFIVLAVLDCRCVILIHLPSLNERDDDIPLLAEKFLKEICEDGGIPKKTFTPGALQELESGASAALLELERAVATRPEYLSVATQLHVIGTR